MISRDQIDLLREAHVQHELALFKGEKFNHALQQEITAFFKSFASVPLNRIVTPHAVLGFMNDLFLHHPIPPEFGNFATQALKEMINVISHDASLVEDVLPEKEFEKLAECAIDLEDLRNDVIHRIVNSPAYSLLIADVLYNGIKDFILTENMLAKMVPGVSSLVQLGKGLVSMAAPELEKKVNLKLVEFIQSNIQGTISQSELFLKETLNKAFLMEATHSWWKSQSKNGVADYTDFLLDDHIDTLIPALSGLGSFLKETTFFSNIVETLIFSFFDLYGEKDIRFILDGFGIKEEELKKKVHHLTNLIEQSEIQAFIENRVRARLGTFYDSAAAASLLV